MGRSKIIELRVMLKITTEVAERRGEEVKSMKLIEKKIYRFITENAAYLTYSTKNLMSKWKKSKMFNRILPHISSTKKK